jgi:hypothetical protein
MEPRRSAKEVAHRHGQGIRDGLQATVAHERIGVQRAGESVGAGPTARRRRGVLRIHANPAAGGPGQPREEADRTGVTGGAVEVARRNSLAKRPEARGPERAWMPR